MSANKAPKHHPIRNSFAPCINGIFQYTANYMTHEYATMALLQRPFGSAKAHEPQASGLHLPKACVFCRPKGQQRCFHDVTSVYMPADASWCQLTWLQHVLITCCPGSKHNCNGNLARATCFWHYGDACAQDTKFCAQLSNATLSCLCNASSSWG